MLPTILLVGLNHTTAPLPVREHALPFVCTRDEFYQQLRAAISPDLFPEFLVLATCNRTEIYTVSEDALSGAHALRQSFALEGVFSQSVQDSLYEYTDRAAVEHLFAVSAGIDSLVLGEFEILGQVRTAYQHASDHHMIGPILHQLFQTASHVGKRVRSETEIGHGAQSVAYAAVALARQQLGNLSGRCALVIGAGEMGRRAAENLSEDGECNVIVASRTFEHAQHLANSLRARAVPIEELETVLTQADVVIGATRAPHFVLYADTIAKACAGRPMRRLCLIDISVPRNIDPDAALLPQVQLYNIDDLHQVVAEARSARVQAIGQVRGIIAEQVDSFWQWYLTRRAAPIIEELYGRADQIRQHELDKTLRRLSYLELGAHEQNIIAALSASLVNKLLAAPTANLKARVASGDGQLYLETLRELFDLQTDAD